MPTIGALVNGLQIGKSLKDSTLPPVRLYEAFMELEKRIKEVEASSGVGGRDYSRANNSGALTIITATPTALAFNQTSYQSNPLIHSDAVGNTKFTAQKDGMYFVSGHIQWPINNIVGDRKIQIRANGGTIVASLTDEGNATMTQDQSISTGVFLFAGEYVEIVVTQTSGGNLIIPVVVNYSPEGVFAEF